MGGGARVVVVASVVVASVVVVGSMAAAGEPRARCLCEEPRRGPVEIRDEFLLAQRRLTLSAVSPDTLGCGRTSARVSLLWSNTFVAYDEREGFPEEGSARVDGETATLDVTVRHGLSAHLDVGVRVPLRWRGEGVLDPVADAFHDLTGLGSGGREDSPVNDYLVGGTTGAGDSFSWDDGVGLGSLELESRWRVRDGGRDGLSVALVGRVALPTGTGPFSNDGVGAGLQVVAAHRIARRLDAFAGLGGTVETDDRVDGLPFETFRAHAFAALEWRPASTWSVLLEQSVTTPLADDLGGLSRSSWYARLGVKVDLTPCATLEAAFVENLFHLDAGADFGVQAGVTFRL
jgi:hypothetical protein